VIRVSAYVIRHGSCRRHKNDLLFATYKVHTENDGLDNLALANSAFAANVEKILVLLGGIICVARPS
jgi:hypothetical protein